jgi:hypothetical protein
MNENFSTKLLKTVANNPPSSNNPNLYREVKKKKKYPLLTNKAIQTTQRTTIQVFYQGFPSYYTRVLKISTNQSSFSRLVRET